MSSGVQQCLTGGEKVRIIAYGDNLTYGWWILSSYLLLLDGLDFHPYLFLDENADGVTDHPDAYEALKECFALVQSD